MELFWKGVAALLVAAVLGLTISRQEKDLSVLVALAACCLGVLAAASLLEPVLELLRQMETMAGIRDEILRILIKSAGLSLVTEIAGMICQDSGSASLGKTLQVLGTAAILYVATPMFTNVLSLIQEILYHL